MSQPAASASAGPVAAEILRLSSRTAIDLRALDPSATFLRILGVNYVHLRTADGGDMYLTEHGVPFIRHLQPENWYETTWFEQHRQRLAGTGTVYRIPTKPLPDQSCRSLDLAIKWSRVGQDVPLDTFTLYKNLNAEFNTPFEEFALLEELRRGEYGPRDVHIHTQKPLAIYVPSERLQLWQTGRSRDKILARIHRRPGVEIDILRSYILIYAWIKGVDAPEAYFSLGYAPAQQEKLLASLTQTVDEDLKKKGFVVADHKPTHVIVRVRDGQVRRRRDGQVSYAIVDYELLARTDPHEDSFRAAKRNEYLVRMAQRFRPRPVSEFPPHLRPCRVLGIDYVFGRTESTGGVLWVVGNDPELFAYFLPERWRLKQVGLSDTGQTYYTHTKDRIHLVWKVSRVGELPQGPANDPRYERALAHGYNCPFEKFALALEMAVRGVKTVYPRAVYMTGSPAELTNSVLDDRRFQLMKPYLSPEGRPVMPIDHDYITIWGYWRGREDEDAVEDTLLWTPIDASQAAAKGLITADTLRAIMVRHEQNLARAGYQDLNLKADHLLLSYIPEGRLKRESDGFPEVRHCNFEFVSRLDSTPHAGVAG